MAERMSKEEREALDAKVIGYVRQGVDPYDAAKIDGVAMPPQVSASLARSARAGTIAYDRVARKWEPVGAKPKAKRAAPAKGKAARVAKAAKGGGKGSK